MVSPSPIAVWWRGKVKKRGDQIVPLQKEPYNPFLHYSPAGVRTPKDEETRSLPYRFLQVDSSSEGAVLAFVERYGVLGDSSHESWSQWAKEAYRTAFQPYERMMIKKDLPTIEEEIAGLSPLRALVRPMPFTEFKSVQSELQETIEWMRQLQENRSRPNSRILEVKIRRRFRYKLAMVRPYADWKRKDGTWQTGWDAGSLESLLYLMVLYDAQGRGEIRVCPWCKKTYMADRPKMKYCSDKCGGALRVDRHRYPERYHHKTTSHRKEKR